MMNNIINGVIIICLLFLFYYVVPEVHAGVFLGRTHLVYDGSKKETSISVNNSDNHGWLIQSWIDNIDDEKLTPSPFLVTPPLFRLGEKQKNVLRIILTSNNLPENKESLFWLNVKSIPPLEDSEQNKNTFQVAIKTRIKLIYRPSGLHDMPEDEVNKLVWKKVNHHLQVFNPTPWDINFRKVTIGGKEIAFSNMNHSWVGPGMQSTLSLPSGISEKDDVSWTVVDDFGGTGKTFHAKL